MDIVLYIAAVVIAILIIIRIRIYFTDCMWFWDDIDKCYRTQCKHTVAYSNDYQNIYGKKCPFCDKEITVNPFIRRTDGTP